MCGDGIVLNSLKVLDLSRVLAGPFCSQHLADLGAHVTKIEHPEKADETRQWGPPFQNEASAYFTAANRNKSLKTLDLADPNSRPTFEALVRESDILVENFLPKTIEHLNLRPEDLHAINPKLIICSISGFGRSSSLANSPGYDFIIQAMSGLMSITGQEGEPPQKVGVAITDVLTSLYASTAILACAYARLQSGKGYHIDLSLWDCAVASQVNLAQAYLMNNEEPGPQGNAHLQIVPYQMFSASDGYFVLAVGNDEQWQRFCRSNSWAWGLEEKYLHNPDRVKNRLELTEALSAEFVKKSTSHWLRICRKARVPSAPVWNYKKVFGSTLGEERNMVISITDHAGDPLPLVGSPFKINGDAITRFAEPPRHPSQPNA